MTPELAAVTFLVVLVLFVIVLALVVAYRQGRCSRCRHMAGQHHGLEAACSSRYVTNPAGLNVRHPCPCPGFVRADTTSPGGHP